MINKNIGDSKMIQRKDVRVIDGKYILVKSFNFWPLSDEDREVLKSRNDDTGEEFLVKARKLKNFDGDGFLAGYMSTFGNKDIVGDVFFKGAFKKTLKERTVRVLFNHDSEFVIGKIIEAKEDKKGLFAIIQLNLDTQIARDVYSNFKFEAIDSFSIGFHLVKFEVREDDDFPWEAYDIKEVKLLEVSAVAIPANDQAMVTEIKEIEDDMLKDTTQSINKTIEDDTEDDLVDILKALVEERKSNDAEIYDFLLEQAAPGHRSETNTPQELHILDKIEKLLGDL